jgi:transposase-like protein
VRFRRLGRRESLSIVEETPFLHPLQTSTESLDEIVRSSVEETLNGLLDAEADQICGAQRYERSAERVGRRRSL